MSKPMAVVGCVPTARAGTPPPDFGVAAQLSTYMSNMRGCLYVIGASGTRYTAQWIAAHAGSSGLLDHEVVLADEYGAHAWHGVPRTLGHLYLPSLTGQPLAKIAAFQAAMCNASTPSMQSDGLLFAMLTLYYGDFLPSAAPGADQDPRHVFVAYVAMVDYLALHRPDLILVHTTSWLLCPNDNGGETIQRPVWVDVNAASNEYSRLVRAKYAWTGRLIDANLRESTHQDGTSNIVGGERALAWEYWRESESHNDPDGGHLGELGESLMATTWLSVLSKLDSMRAQIAAISACGAWFAHRSVGTQLTTQLGLYCTGDAMTVTSTDIAVSMGAGIFAHVAEGNNGDPIGKIDLFASVIRGGVGAKLASTGGILALKFCYGDVVSGVTDVAAVAAYLATTWIALRDEYPACRFLMCTVPLKTDGDSDGRATNVLRERLSDYIRVNTGVFTAVFDLALRESTHADGSREIVGGVPALCTEWSSDGGHLSAGGIDWVTRHLVQRLAEVAA